MLLQEKKKLQVENIELEEEASLLESKLQGLNKSLRLLNNGTDALGDLLEASKKGKSKIGIDLDYNSTNEERQNPKKKFVASEGKSEFVNTMIFKSLPICYNILPNMLTPQSEASSRLHGYVTTVEGMDIYDLIVIDYMSILGYLLNLRYLKQRFITRRNGRSRKKHLL